LEAAVASDERKAKVGGSCSDDAVGHIGNDTSRNILKSVCNRGIYGGDEQSCTGVDQGIAESLQGGRGEFLSLN